MPSISDNRHAHSVLRALAVLLHETFDANNIEFAAALKLTNAK